MRFSPLFSKEGKGKFFRRHDAEIIKQTSGTEAAAIALNQSVIYAARLVACATFPIDSRNLRVGRSSTL